MKEIKNALVGVITLAITTLGGLYVNKLVNTVDVKDEVEAVPTPVSKKDTIVVIQKVKKRKKKTQPVEVAKPLKKEYEW